MSIGMFFHRTASPIPSSPTFVRYISTTVAPKQGKIDLCFYTPLDYNAHLRRSRPGKNRDHSAEERTVGLSPPPSDSSNTDSDTDCGRPSRLRNSYPLRSGPFRRLLRRKRSPTPLPASRRRYPVVVNFHGGGFTLGKATDDCRWATSVVARTGAVVVSVGYRLAPEFPFPTAVEDGVDALLWLSQHGEELDLDVQNITLSGFSSGGNLCFTVPLRLDAELKRHGLEGLVGGRVIPSPSSRPNTSHTHRDDASVYSTLASAKTKINSPLPGPRADVELTPFNPRDHVVRSDTDASIYTYVDTPHVSTTNLAVPPLYTVHRGGTLTPASFAQHAQLKSQSHPLSPAPVLPKHSIPASTSLYIRGIVSFYPSVDYTRTRAQRKATCTRPEMNLPVIFTRMFDDSYIGNANLFQDGSDEAYQLANSTFYFPSDHPSLSTATLNQPSFPAPEILALASPFLSPGVAHDNILRRPLPDNIVVLSSQWDMLTQETHQFVERLASFPAANPKSISSTKNDHLIVPAGFPRPIISTSITSLISPEILKPTVPSPDVSGGGGGGGMTKNVKYWVVPDQPHAWDKKPYFWGREAPFVAEWYGRACDEIASIAGMSPEDVLRNHNIHVPSNLV